MNKIEPSLAVGVLIFNHEGKMFIGKSPKWNGKWIVPGGHKENNESFRECVKREIKEELGIEIKNIRYLQIQKVKNPKNYYEPNKHFVFKNFSARTKEANPKVAINKEFEEYNFVTPAEAFTLFDLNEPTRKLVQVFIMSKKSSR